MNPFADLGAFLGIASGIAAAFLGAYILLLPRTAATVSFAVFAMLWGWQSAVANLANASHSLLLASAWAHANVALLIPLHLPLLWFAWLYPHRPARAGFVLASCWPAAALLVTYAARPTLFIADFIVNEATYPVLVPGPMFVPVALFNVVVAFVAALIVLVRRYAASESRSARSQLALVVAGLLTITSYKATEALFYGLPWEKSFWGAAPRADVVLIWAAALATVLTGAWINRAVGRGEPWRRLLLVAWLLPFGVGVLEWFTIGLWPSLHTVGLWRVGSIVLFAYAIGRLHLFDLDLRLQRAAPLTAYLATALILSIVAWFWLADPFAQKPYLGISCTLGIFALLSPGIRPLRTRLQRSDSTSKEALHQRRLEVYTEAMKHAPSRRQGRHRGRLRQELGITAAEHNIIQGLVGMQNSLRGTAPIRPGLVMADRFLVKGTLGAGGNGIVHLAKDQQTNQTVVVKEVRRADADRSALAMEGWLMASVTHPNLVRFIDLIHHEGHPILIMEHLPGGDLEQRLAEGALRPARALEVIRSVAGAAQALHENGIVHGDIKPTNVLFDAHGEARLADLGSARPDGSQAGPATHAYASPEQKHGQPVGARTDVYGLAALLVELLSSGEARDTDGTDAVTDGHHDRLAQLPSPVAAVLARALAQEPGDRFRTVGQFCTALDKAASTAWPWTHAGKGFAGLDVAASEASRSG